MRCSARLRDPAHAHSPLPLDIIVAIVLCTLGICSAGPVDRQSRMMGGNPMLLDTNVTSGQMGKACAVGDVVYMPGDTVPGSIPCELCICGPSGGVQCEAIECEPGSGCKALHRPDHCCPLYQCDCEEDGHTYVNGEKRVDSEDPCRVCYCQGGVIICSRLACFERDDCDPRFVDGQCCPKYDHCPPRGGNSDHKHDIRATDNVTMLMTKPQLSLDPTDDDSLLKHSSEPFENGREIEAKELEKPKNTSMKINEIRIKEVTQKMEIPADTGIRIKEVHPLINREINQYTPGSTKAPLSPREAEYNTQAPLKETATSNIKYQKVEDLNETLRTAYPSSPVLRIGDQLLFLKVGDLIQEPDSLSTPATVITVFGAEGLIRGEEDEFTENETSVDNDNKEYESSLSEGTNIGEDNNTDLPSTTFNPQNDLNTGIKFNKLTKNMMLPAATVNEYNNSSNVKRNEIDETTLAQSTEMNGENSTPFPNSKDLLEYTYAISSTENPATTNSSPTESEYTTVGVVNYEVNNGNSLESSPLPQEPKYETKIVVKRPILSVPNIKILHGEKPAKIIPEVLLYLKDNETSNNHIASTAASTLVPEEWLKSTNPPSTSLNISPLLNLEGALPDDILDATLSTEIKGNLDFNMENEKREHESDVMGSDELLIELRAHGEPILVPEWEQNITAITKPSVTSGNVDEDLKIESIETNTLQSHITDSTTSGINENVNVSEADLSKDHFKIIVSEPYSDLTAGTQNNDMNNTEDELKISDTFETETLKNVIDSVQASVATENDHTLTPTEYIYNPTTLLEVVEEYEKPVSTFSSDSEVIDDKLKNKSNILADLISLVGDVAAIGDHNAQENSSKKRGFDLKVTDPMAGILHRDTNEFKMNFSSANNNEMRHIELSDITPMEDHDLPSEHKTEPTTRKPIIDHVSHKNQNESNVMDTNDIEIIPKVENYPHPDDYEPKKIIQEPSSSIFSTKFKNKKYFPNIGEETTSIRIPYSANTDEIATIEPSITEIDLSQISTHTLEDSSDGSKI